MAYENNEQRIESAFSSRVRAGKRRTYFFDVRATRNNDYFLTITESRKRFDENSYERHKIFLYKEDFNKFAKALNEAVDYVKTELMPDYDFDSFSHEGYEENGNNEVVETVEETEDSNAVMTSEVPSEPIVNEVNVTEPIVNEVNATEPIVSEVNVTAPIATNDIEEVDKW